MFKSLSIESGSLLVLAMAQLLEIASAARGHFSLGLSKFITWNINSISAKGIDTFSRELSLTVEGRNKYLFGRPYGQVSFPHLKRDSGSEEWMERHEWDTDHALVTFTAVDGFHALLVRGRNPIAFIPDDMEGAGPTKEVDDAHGLEVEVQEGDQFMLWYTLSGEKREITEAHKKDWIDFLCNNEVTVESLRSFIQSLGPISQYLTLVYGQVMRGNYIDGRLASPQKIKVLNLEGHEGQLELEKIQSAKERKQIRQDKKAKRDTRLNMRNKFIAKHTIPDDRNLQRVQKMYNRSQKVNRGRQRVNKEPFSEPDLEDVHNPQ